MSPALVVAAAPFAVLILGVAKLCRVLDGVERAHGLTPMPWKAQLAGRVLLILAFMVLMGALRPLG